MGRSLSRWRLPVSTRQNAGLARPGDSVKQLDDIDHRLIAMLQDNARLPVVALARAVRLSRSAVQERLQRLESSGVIEQYTLRLGKGAEPLQAWLLLRHAEGFSCDDVMPLLADIPHVQSCYSVAGGTDLMVLVRVQSPSQLADLRERIAASRSIDAVTTLTVLRVLLERG